MKGRDSDANRSYSIPSGIGGGVFQPYFGSMLTVPSGIVSDRTSCDSYLSSVMLVQ